MFSIPLVFPPISLHLIRIVSLARDKCVSFLSAPLCLLLSLSLVLSSAVCISHGTLLASALLQASLSVVLRLTLYLSIVHNYTIRLLNRLMRPPLPAVATPFTETTGRARASSLLSLPPSFRLAHVLEILTVTYPRPVPPRSCALLRALIFRRVSRLSSRALFRFQFHRMPR